MSQLTLLEDTTPKQLVLSKYQNRIKDHVATIDERVVKNFAVSAAAGSGKSFTITQLILMLYEMYKGKVSILSLQFNAHIRDQMKAKMGQMNGVDIHTLSGAGLMVCKENNFKMKNNRPAWTKYGSLLVGEYLKDNKGRIMAAAKEVGLPSADKWDKINNKAYSQLTDILNMACNTLTDLTDPAACDRMCQLYSKEAFHPIIFEGANEIINKGMAVMGQGMIAFLDMLYGPIFHDMEFPKYDYILCDEFQDFNACQLELISRFCHEGTVIGGFGDEDQSIMMFTGAMNDSVFQFKKKFGCRTMPLSICYRCPSKVLDLARIVVPKIENRPNCPEGIVEIIQTKEKIAAQVGAGDYIICRLTAPLVEMCIKIIQLRKPAKVKGKEVGDRIIKMYDEVIEFQDCFSCEEFLAALKMWRDAEQLRLINKKSSAEKLTAMNDTADCLRVVGEYLSEEGRQARRPIHHSDVKKEISRLFAKDDDVNDNMTILCTVHKAKGLEADNVYILHLEKMPFTHPGKPQSPEEFQQERHILYVALTRPKKALYLHGEEILTMEDAIAHINKCRHIDKSAEESPF